jgi:hypothetical protein
MTQIVSSELNYFPLIFLQLNIEPSRVIDVIQVIAKESVLNESVQADEYRQIMIHDQMVKLFNRKADHKILHLRKVD